MSSPFAQWSDASRPARPLGVVLRPAVTADQDALNEIQAASSRRSVDLERMLDEMDRAILVAEHAGGVVGWAATQFFAEPDGAAGAGHYLAGVTVLPSARRRGVGLRLTEARLEWIWDRAEYAWYFANDANTVSIALHARLGFEQVAEVASVRGIGFQSDRGLLFRARRPHAGPTSRPAND